MVQLGILLSACVFFLAGIGGFLLPFFYKKMKGLPFIPISWAGALFLSVTLFLMQVADSVLLNYRVPIPFICIFFLAAAGIVVMPLLYGKTLKKQSFFIALWCLAGTFLLPLPIENSIALIGVRCIIAGLWTFFILAYTELDRIPLEGFVLILCLFLMFLLFTTPIFPFLPAELFSGCLCASAFLLIILFIFKKNGIVSLGFPLVFLFTYIAAYLLSLLALQPNGAYILIALAYPIAECVGAMSVNIYRHHRLFPIEVPFITEYALAKGTPAKKVFKSLFYTLVLTECIAVISMRNQSSVWVAGLFMAFVILYNFYAVSFQILPKVSLKNVGKDAKKGLEAFWKEMKTVPLKKTAAPSADNGDTVCSVTDAGMPAGTESSTLAVGVKNKTGRPHMQKASDVKKKAVSRKKQNRRSSKQV